MLPRLHQVYLQNPPQGGFFALDSLARLALGTSLGHGEGS